MAVTLNSNESNSNYHNYLTAQNSYDSDTDQQPLVRSHQKHSVNEYEFDDSGGEFGDLCVDSPDKNDSYTFDAEAQVWSSTGGMRLP